MDTANDLQSLGDRLLQYLTRRELNAHKAAQIAGMPGKTLSRVVNGENFQAEVLNALVEAFGDLDLDWLVTGQGHSPAVSPLNLSLEDLQEQLDACTENLDSLTEAERVQRGENLLGELEKLQLRLAQQTLEIAEIQRKVIRWNQAW